MSETSVQNCFTLHHSLSHKTVYIMYVNINNSGKVQNALLLSFDCSTSLSSEDRARHSLCVCVLFAARFPISFSISRRSEIILMLLMCTLFIYFGFCWCFLFVVAVRLSHNICEPFYLCLFYINIIYDCKNVIIAAEWLPKEKTTDTHEVCRKKPKKIHFCLIQSASTKWYLWQADII